MIAERKPYNGVGFQGIRDIAIVLGIDEEELSGILEIDHKSFEEALNRGGVPEGSDQYAIEVKLKALVDLFGFILSISRTNQDLIRMWRGENNYRNPFRKPVWDAVGMEQYLRVNKYNGVLDALSWISKYAPY